MSVVVLCVRIVLGLAGTYLATSSIAICLEIAMLGIGVPKVDVVTLGILLEFIIYVGLILWVFAARSLWPVVLAFSLLYLSSHSMLYFFG